MHYITPQAGTKCNSNDSYSNRSQPLQVPSGIVIIENKEYLYLGIPVTNCDYLYFKKLLCTCS